MVKVYSLQFLAVKAAVKILLDHEDQHSFQLRQNARLLIKQLSTQYFTAISLDVLQAFVNQHPRLLTGELLDVLAAPHLKRLCLNHCTRIFCHRGELKYMKKVMKKCTHLQHIELNACHPPSEVTSELCQLISHYLPTLTSLSFEDCKTVTNADVQIILFNCLNLSWLNLSMCPAITDNVFNIQPSSSTDSIRSSVEGGTTFLPVGAGSPGQHLTSVDVSFNQNLTSVCIRHLIALCGESLQALNVSCTGMDCTLLWYLCGYYSWYDVDAEFLSNLKRKNSSGKVLSNLLRDYQSLKAKVDKQMKVTRTEELGANASFHRVENSDDNNQSNECIRNSGRKVPQTDDSGERYLNPESDFEVCHCCTGVSNLKNLNDEINAKGLSTQPNKNGNFILCSKDNENPLTNILEKNNTEKDESEMILFSRKNEEIEIEDETVKYKSSDDLKMTDPLNLDKVDFAFLELPCFLKHEDELPADKPVVESILCSQVHTLPDDEFEFSGSRHLLTHGIKTPQGSAHFSKDCVKKSSAHVREKKENFISNEIFSEYVNNKGQLPDKSSTDQTLNTVDFFPVDDSSSSQDNEPKHRRHDSNVSLSSRHDESLNRLVSEFVDSMLLEISQTENNTDFNGDNIVENCGKQRFQKESSEQAPLKEAEDIADLLEPRESLQIYKMNRKKVLNIKHLDITNIDFDGDLGEICLQEFLRVNRCLLKLNLSWREIKDELLSTVQDSLSQLKWLSLIECEKITSYGLASLLNVCKNLGHLNIEGMYFINDTALYPLFEDDGRCGVHSLKLSEMYITDNSLYQIAKSLGQKLTVLHLNWCEEITDAGLSTIATNCPHLKDFAIRQCSPSKSTLLKLANNCSDLVSLNVAAINCLTDEIVITLATQLSLLATLDISWNSDLTDTAVSSLFINCPLLHDVCLDGLKPITSKPFLLIIAERVRWRRCQALIKLKLMEQKLLIKTGEPHLSSDEEYEDLFVPTRSTTYAVQLRYLSLQYCDLVNDRHLAEIVAVCKGTLTIKDYYGEPIVPKLLDYR